MRVVAALAVAVLGVTSAATSFSGCVLPNKYPAASDASQTPDASSIHMRGDAANHTPDEDMDARLIDAPPTQDATVTPDSAAAPDAPPPADAAPADVPMD